MFSCSKFAGLCAATIVSAPVLLSIPSQASAATFSWENIAQNGQWEDGQQGGLFQAGSGQFNIGFEVGSSAEFISFESGGMTPAISSTLNGSNPDDERSLHLQIKAEEVGLGKGDNSITMNVAFEGYSSLLSGVSFLLYDVDISNIGRWQDRVQIKGFADGEVVAPTFSNFNPNVIRIVDDFTIDGIADADNESDLGNILVSFDQPIGGLSLTYTDGPDVDRDSPAGHGIGVGNINYDDSQSVPEPTSILGLVAMGLLGASVKSSNSRKQA